MSEFEKWKAKHLASGESKTWGEWCKEAFKAGQQGSQAIIDDLQNQLKLCREENKGLIKSLNDEKKLIDAMKLEVECFESYSEYKYFDENTESAVLMGTMDGFLEGLNKALRGENEK